MQRSEPGAGGAGYEGDVTVTPPERPRARLQSRRARLWLALGGGIMALLCLGGAGVVFVLFNDATEINRSEPDIVADAFLIAYLVNRDDQQAQLYTCDSPDLQAIKGLRDEFLRREAEFKVTVSVSWGALYRASTGQNQEDVSTQLTISSAANGKMNSSRNEEWVFKLQDQGGSWRVCGAAKQA
ncbi:hypothetical protein [Actinoplanes flavus]|uniref:Mce-associated membrane protein n=1 Tax=Actinoplanes flavus TaxID=2820290 RepID=A0ABS3UYA9_9ACTN|nr:hypothetical protein [Actinoplanes flavus]MBO3743570.1 hypothetical protein [Actinoplanes flavus]